jgi:hypothetical protein
MGHKNNALDKNLFSPYTKTLLKYSLFSLAFPIILLNISDPAAELGFDFATQQGNHCSVQIFGTILVRRSQFFDFRIFYSKLKTNILWIM